MCFLYRQSISIVYESKFKYIYRYFIKIDRCFCGILQSLPLRKCGLKSICPFIHTAQPIVTSLAEVWIEIPTAPPSSSGSWSLPLRKCGLKFQLLHRHPLAHGHFPCGSVDWNLTPVAVSPSGYRHFPCGSVDWNTYDFKSLTGVNRSLPLRKCGLKCSFKYPTVTP